MNKHPRPRSHFSKVDALTKTDTVPRPVSTVSDLKNTFVSILDGHEEFVLSIEGQIIGSNLEAVNLTGYEEWEVIGKHFTLFYLPEEKSDNLHLEHLSKAEAHGKAIFEGWKLKKRGVKFFARIRFVSICNSLNELTGYRMIVSDITHKVVYNGKLQKIREKYLSIYNNAFVGIVAVSSEDFHIIHSNAKAKQILGGKHDNLKNAFEEAHQFEIFRNQLAQNGAIQGFEFKTRFSNGDEKWISFDCHQHANEQTIEGVIIDITQLKKHELEINKLTKEVNSFIYHASHELRSPMSTILGILNLISMEKKTDPVVTNYASMIRERVKAQDQLLKDLTGVIYNNTAPVHLEYFNFNIELPDILKEFLDVYHEVKIDIKVLSDLVKTDVVRMRAVLRNILSNSFKYGSKIEAKIEISVFKELDGMNISIKDNGIGMSDDQLMMVFNLFHRSHEGYPGNGLGLYLVKSILTTLGGEIKIKSKKNIGTEVLLILS